MKTLRVVKFKDGSVLRKSSNDDKTFSAMVESSDVIMSQRGTFYEQKRIGFIRGTEAILKSLGVAENSDINASLAKQGRQTLKIVVNEQTSPFYEGQAPKLYPESHEQANQPVKDINGNNIYRETIVVPDSPEFQDVIIASYLPDSASAPVSKVAEVGDLANM